jgi:hypothetical protein
MPIQKMKSMMEAPEDGSMEAGDAHAAAELHRPGEGAGGVTASAVNEPARTGGSVRKRAEEILANLFIRQQPGARWSGSLGLLQVKHFRLGAQLFEQTGGAATGSGA